MRAYACTWVHTHMHISSVMSDSLPTPWTVAHQVPLYMEFSRQEYWNWLPFLSPASSSGKYQEKDMAQGKKRKDVKWLNMILGSE